MANNAKTAEISAQEEVKVETKATKAKSAAASVYTAEELADNHRVFGTSREIVVVALRQAGKKTATEAEAKNIIDKFKTKEVK